MIYTNYYFLGTFDPVHDGHIHIIKSEYARCLIPHNVVKSQLIIGITAQNPQKGNTMYTLDERVSMMINRVLDDVVGHSDTDISLKVVNNTDELTKYHIVGSGGISIVEVDSENTFDFFENKLDESHFYNKTIKSVFNYLIIGADQLYNINTWANATELLERLDGLVVYPRTESPVAVLRFVKSELGIYSNKIDVRLQNKHTHISSTELRNNIKNKRKDL